MHTLHPTLRRLPLRLGVLALGLALFAGVPLPAQDVFVTFVHRQVDAGVGIDPRGFKIKAPGGGWTHSAAAPVGGDVWNMVQRPNPLINANSTGAPGAFPVTSAFRLPLVDSQARETTVMLIASLEIERLTTDTTRMEPNTVKGVKSKLSPNGLMDEGWRLFSNGTVLTLVLSGLKPSTSYDLYLYGADETGRGAAFEIVSETPAKRVQTHGGAGVLFVRENRQTTPVPEGQSWVRASTRSDPQGVIAFRVLRNAQGECFFNGFQLIEIGAGS
jgi:hypothetical protein